MTGKDAYQLIITVLDPIYGEREAASMAKYLLEDSHSIHSVHSTQEVDNQQLKQQLGLLKNGKPLAQVTGVAYFYNLKLEINEEVLIPRPETEELVEWGLQRLQQRNIENPCVLDVGTGSGCIALSIAQEAPTAQVMAIDVSEGALRLAQKNAANLKLRVEFKELSALKKEDWEFIPLQDLIISNPPYIPPSERVPMPASVTTFEPDLALFTPEEDPMQFYRALAQWGQS
ncbi:MAG: HemK/PrmC family methyltransferase [Bacteroidota bacterium]